MTQTDASLERRLSHLLAMSRLLQKTQEEKRRVTHPNMPPQPLGHMLPQEPSLAWLWVSDAMNTDDLIDKSQWPLILSETWYQLETRPKDLGAQESHTDSNPTGFCSSFITSPAFPTVFAQKERDHILRYKEQPWLILSGLSLQQLEEGLWFLARDWGQVSAVRALNPNH